MTSDEQFQQRVGRQIGPLASSGGLPRSEVLLRRWNNIRHYLNRAAALLRAHGSWSTARESPSQARLQLDLLDHYLEHNELGLALDIVCQDGHAQAIAGSFWLYAALAARCMAMPDRAAAMLRRYHDGTDDPITINQVNIAVLEEVRRQRLGVTQQFFQIHQLPDDPIALTHLRPCQQKADSFLHVRNEPYFWVMQLERTRSGQWQACWGYCSHRAEIYLSISDEELRPDLISDWLGFASDQSHEKGAPIRPRPGSRCYDKHRWSLESPAAICRDFHGRLNDLLTTIEPFVESLKQLQCRETTSMSIVAVLYDSVEWTFNFGLSRSVVQQLSAAGLGVEFDLYHSGPLLPSDEA